MMANVATNNSHIKPEIKNRRYRLTGGNSFLVENVVQHVVASKKFYQEYGAGLSSEPHLAFLRLLHDGEAVEDRIVLEGYFNDLYKLFLRKMADFDCQVLIADEDKVRLRLLLEEMIKVKAILYDEKTLVGDDIRSHRD
jgi:hypothetical protein